MHLYYDVQNYDKITRLEIMDNGCCGVRRNNGVFLFNSHMLIAKNIYSRMFIETTNIFLAKVNYTSQSYPYPINIQQLANP